MDCLSNYIPAIFLVIGGMEAGLSGSRTPIRSQCRLFGIVWRGGGEAVSREAVGPEMAVRERRGFALGSPAESRKQLLLLLLLGSCSGRIHWLALTVSLTAWQSEEEVVILSQRSISLGVVSSYFPLRRMEQSGSPTSRPRVVSSQEPPSVLRMELPGWPRKGRAALIRGGASSSRPALPPHSTLIPLNSWDRFGRGLRELPGVL